MRSSPAHELFAAIEVSDNKRFFDPRPTLRGMASVSRFSHLLVELDDPFDGSCRLTPDRSKRDRAQCMRAKSCVSAGQFAG